MKDEINGYGLKEEVAGLFLFDMLWIVATWLGSYVKKEVLLVEFS